MGGARINAGRKLDPIPRVRILIGAECERLATERAEDASLAQYRTLMAPTEISTIQAAVRRVRDGDATEDDELDAADAENNIDDLMKDLKRSHPKVGGGFVRAISIPVRRPKGPKGEMVRKQIMAQVAKGFHVKVSVVDRCWKEYRRFLKGDPTPWRRPSSQAA